MISDLDVELSSSSLAGKHIDVVVTGSIAAVESIKFIRRLRKLGATVHPWMSAGARQFITKDALAWAANNTVVENFSGELTHLATRDGVVVSPASANFIAKLASGITDDPALALCSSYLGQKKPLLFVPCMHESLALSPFFIRQKKFLSEFVKFLEPKYEESKLKFPDPDNLADECSHEFNKFYEASRISKGKVLVTLGPTRAYLDPVRYISNYSSGALGSEISNELYRYGFDVLAICGASEIKPRRSVSQLSVTTYHELKEQLQSLLKKPYYAFIHAAAVLDFEPEITENAKKSSKDNWSINLKPTEKLLNYIDKKAINFAFKLTTEKVNQQNASTIAQSYIEKHNLNGVIVNSLSAVSAKTHQAYFVVNSTQQDKAKVVELNSKQSIANAVTEFLK